MRSGSPLPTLLKSTSRRGVELVFQRVPGVVQTAVGYSQGRTKNPTYQEVGPNSVCCHQLADCLVLLMHWHSAGVLLWGRRTRRIIINNDNWPPHPVSPKLLPRAWYNRGGGVCVPGLWRIHSGSAYCQCGWRPAIY